MLELFHNRQYRHLFGAQVIALIGTGLTTVGLALLASDLAGANAGEVLGIALAIKMVAYVTIAPIAGAYAHRLPRRTLLVVLDLLRASVVVALPFVTQIWQIYLLILLLNTCSASFTPAFQATIPDIIDDETQYTRALSLSRLAYDLENLLSPMAAALLLMVMDFNILFVLNAAAFISSALLVITVSLPSQAAPSISESIGQKLTHGLNIYLKTPRLRGLLALSFAVSAAGAMQIVNTVVYVRHTLGLDSSHVALAFAAAGGGSMIVALGLPHLLERLNQRSVMLSGGLIMSLCLGAGLTQPSFLTLLTIWCFMGAGAALVMTPTGRLIKQSCHPEDRPTVFAAQFSLSHAGWLITYPLAGWIGGQVSLSAAFALLGALALSATLAATRLWPRHDQLILEHWHHAQHHTHWHHHDDHHQHHHEGWEGPAPHAHPHTHTAGQHRHILIIDHHHPHWPHC